MIPSLFLRALSAPDADRPSVLEAFLRDRGVIPQRTFLAGSLHLAVRFPDPAYDPRFRTKLLVAHHDRRAGGAGILDNGAACLQLADLAVRLASRTEPHNTVILFTDSEETSSADAQGSYSVARALAGRPRSLTGEEEPPAVFVFDVTGRGTVPVLSSTARDLLASRGMGTGDLAARLRDLDSWAGRALRRVAGSSPARLPVPWSDDLGFALGGVPAVTVTLLPGPELDAYRESLAAVRRRGDDGTGIRAREIPEDVPRTWSLLHGPGDNLDALEEESFEVMARILDAFGELRIPRVRRIR